MEGVINIHDEISLEVKESEGVGDCFLTPTHQFIPAKSWRELVNFQ